MHQFSKPFLISIFCLSLVGCAVFTHQYDFTSLYGKPSPQNRVVEVLPPDHIDYWSEVKPVVESRCVVCHGCYDAPCQLKMTAIEGIERGANSQSVYNQSRLTAATLTRLFEDETTTQGWRNRDFFPVLNEHQQTPEANKHASVMYRLLLQKEEQPLPIGQKILGDEFTFGVNRVESCPTPQQIDNHIEENPKWGMPYALPGLNADEQNKIKIWIEQGSQYTARAPLSQKLLNEVEQWESFLNRPSLKARLVSRYIYEHLFLGHMYFEDADKRTFFRLVRSKTPSGKKVENIPTRRPYDDPLTDTFYYRFVPIVETIVYKSHLPYALNSHRMANWQQLFFDAEYSVDSLPSYDTPNTANPFFTFAQLPTKSKYKFMLEEARFTIMNYIKGPVCRGGVALNVIQDHFWVFFVDPDVAINDAVSAKIYDNFEDLELPSVKGDIYTPLTTWGKYAQKARNNRAERDQFMLNYFTQNDTELGLDFIWDGDGKNKNAALTIFRHFDSATVEKGLVGENPKTAWVISYPLLEQIHYLLVAGYDVYGNLGHNLLSRIHMDFLRMDGEAAFLMLLPKEAREDVRNYWYKEASDNTLDYLRNPEFEKYIQSNIAYKTDDPKQELYQLLSDHLGSALDTKYSLSEYASTQRSIEILEALETLGTFTGASTTLLSEVTFLEVVSEDTSEFFTILRNTEHINMTKIFGESSALAPEENNITIVKGFLGAYPNTYLKVDSTDIQRFASNVLTMSGESDYRTLLDEFGVRRTNLDFWQHSDKVHRHLREQSEVEFGYLDYNRLENR